MNCPRCVTSSMIELDRDGVTIDRCERCRGIWLDRGELEKLIARDTERLRAPVEEHHDDPLERHEDERDRRRHRDDDDDDDDGARRDRGRRSWWSLFD